MDGGGVPYASTHAPSSGVSGWSVPRPTYVSDSQTYLPVMLPNSQSIGPTQGWSTYVVSILSNHNKNIYRFDGYMMAFFL